MWRVLIAISVLLAGTFPALAGAQIVLRDGRTLKGVDVRREREGGATYVLILELGSSHHVVSQESEVDQRGRDRRRGIPSMMAPQRFQRARNPLVSR